MKRLLTAGIFGTILGIVSTGTANASIVSSGFLDEKLTEYALSTSLDLKANQSDLTALNDIVGKETWDDFLNLKLGNFPNYSELFFTDNDPNKGLGIDNLSQSTLINFTITGFPTLAGVTDKFLHGWTNSDRLTRQGLIALNEGWTDKNDGTTYLGVKDLNTKIGTLPEGITVQAMYDGWTDINGSYFPGLYEIAGTIFKFNNLFPKVSIGMLLADGLEEYTYNNYTGPVYPLWKLSEGIDKIGSIETKIGTLPAGYDSVGAALTAIKGIAEDAKAAALAAIPDPKQEGSSGKFVLTVDIVGDNATYRWEKIDREGETTTVTTE